MHLRSLKYIIKTVYKPAMGKHGLWVSCRYSPEIHVEVYQVGNVWKFLVICPEIQLNLSENPRLAVLLKYIIEPPHDKTNKMIVRPAKTQISLGIRPSDQSLCCALNG